MSPAVPDTTALIGGPYRPPRVKVGGTAFCLYRDCDVVITSVTAARIPWPRCRRVGSVGGGSGLLINETLLRAIRTESAEAIKYWFGVGTNAVWAWRKAFGVGQWGTPGSRRLLAAVTAKGNATCRGKRLPKAAVEERRQRAIELRLAQHLRQYQHDNRRVWTESELSLLGTMPDTRLARRLGVSRDVVRRERGRRGIPRFRKPVLQEAGYSHEQREQLRRKRNGQGKVGKKGVA